MSKERDWRTIVFPWISVVYDEGLSIRFLVSLFSSCGLVLYLTNPLVMFGWMVCFVIFGISFAFLRGEFVSGV
jgi:hypothetical protein